MAAEIASLAELSRDRSRRWRLGLSFRRRVVVSSDRSGRFLWSSWLYARYIGQRFTASRGDGAWPTNRKSNGPTQRGTPSGVARRSAPAAPTATPRRSPSGSAASPAIPTSRGSTSGSSPRSWSSRSGGRERRMIFVNSMSDLFHKDVSDDYVGMVAEVMRAANWHTYQVLTKRSERLGRDAPDRPPRARPRAAHLVGRERREPPTRLAANRPPPRRAGRRAVPLRRTAARRPRGRST